MSETEISGIKFAFENLYEALIKLLTLPQLWVIAVLIVSYRVIKEIRYRKTSYYKETGNSLKNINHNKGMRGEYLIYKRLKPLEKIGCKFLFNLYIPRNDTQMSEIDVLVIFKNGIIVFESKNYSGWIFGNVDQKMWIQTLPKGKGKSEKNSFYNPIFQNHTHINSLKKIVGTDIPIYSVVVFSERCNIKKLTGKSNIPVIYRDEIFSTVEKILETGEKSDLDVNEIYQKLSLYKKASEEIKRKHIEKIKADN